MRAKQPTDDERSQAWTCLHNSYRADVDSMVDTMLEFVATGEVATIEKFHEYLAESCENTQRVIYTGRAIECLLLSENEDAYYEEHGTGMPDDVDTIPWSTLAFYAFREDVLEMIESWAGYPVDLFNHGPDIKNVAQAALDAFTEGKE